MVSKKTKAQHVDVVLIGGGVVSATLGALLHELEPGWSQMLIERLDAPGLESSSPWNNAGTGHSALCELNYTPLVDGHINVAQAVSVNEKFQISRQFWSYEVNQGILPEPTEFINSCPHVSFGHGNDVGYIKQRWEELSTQTVYPNLQFTKDEAEFAELLPLMGEGREENTEAIAISWSDDGTDVNFGAQTRQFIQNGSQENLYGAEVIDIKPEGKAWRVTYKKQSSGELGSVIGKFVFVGAGGKALPLLQKSGIPEIRGYGGFPVSGQWLRCTNEDVIARHAAKVYGKPALGSPPMSVPHLDTRIINGKSGLLFGPYAGWTPKFLKYGNYSDLPKTIKLDNIPSYLGVGLKEIGLTKYLITEVVKTFEQRMDLLRTYMPNAESKDWELITAGQRVQVIAPARAPKFGSLEFGTAVISNSEGTLAGLLGASPGASIAPAAMLELVERCFGNKMVAWGPKIKEMIPSYGHKLNDEPKLFEEMWDYTQKTLKLDVNRRELRASAANIK